MSELDQARRVARELRTTLRETLPPHLRNNVTVVKFNYVDVEDDLGGKVSCRYVVGTDQLVVEAGERALTIPGAQI